RRSAGGEADGPRCARGVRTVRADRMRGSLRGASVDQASCGLDWASFSVATALPATDLYRIAQERGYVDGDFWKEYTVNGGGLIPQLETETFTAEQLRAYRTKAYMKFYMRPDLIRRKLSKSEGRDELLEMASGATVLSEIVKAQMLKRIPRVGLGKWGTV
ncbi:MAG: hypothetical protein QGG40_04130, partial [Myxococcota bacterium]|nr:hypothetical protein [Myxococcota bacterium]